MNNNKGQSDFLIAVYLLQVFNNYISFKIHTSARTIDPEKNKFQPWHSR